MKYLILIFFFMVVGCKYCEDRLIGDDPYQFEEIKTKNLERELWLLEIKIKNGIADRLDKKVYKQIQIELENRRINDQ